MFIDTHCHLNFENYNDDRAMVIGNAKKAGVKQFIIPGVDTLSSRISVKLAQEYPNVIFAGIGYHPYEAQELPQIRILESLLGPEVVAIGECGLDHHLYKDEVAAGKKTNQKRLFAEQLEFAVKHNLPVICHCRDAYEDFFDTIDSISNLPRGVIHCFSGGLQEIRFAQQRGLFIGIDGNLTFSKHLQSIIPEIPLSMLLLETDAPFLTPTPHRGTRNEPKYIPLIAETIARLKTTDVKTVADITTKNAQSLFNLPLTQDVHLS